MSETVGASSPCDKPRATVGRRVWVELRNEAVTHRLRRREHGRQDRLLEGRLADAVGAADHGERRRKIELQLRELTDVAEFAAEWIFMAGRSV